MFQDMTRRIAVGDSPRGVQPVGPWLAGWDRKWEQISQEDKDKPKAGQYCHPSHTHIPSQCC